MAMKRTKKKDAVPPVSLSDAGVGKTTAPAASPNGGLKAEVRAEAGHSFPSSPGVSSDRYRVLESHLDEILLASQFDRIRYEIECYLSRPFTRRRFDHFGRWNMHPEWDGMHAKRLRVEAEAARLSAYGSAFLDPVRLGRSQCELRTLLAQCRAFEEDYDGAFRELRLAIGALDRTTPRDRFLEGIVCGFQAETFLLRADSHLRRNWSGDTPWERFSQTQAVRRRLRARRDLDLAASHSSLAQDLIRDDRRNVSRWEWLHELQAQLVIERILLRAFELDFEIDIPSDDWSLVGALQREITEGLEAIRAGLDCTLYPEQLPPLQSDNCDETNSDGADEFAYIKQLHKRLLGLWLQLMVGSFWVLRSLSITPQSSKETRGSRSQSPRLAATERFAAHGSRGSFWQRWVALNQAAGLERLVQSRFDSNHGGTDGDTSTSAQVNQDLPGAVAREALDSLSSIGGLLEGRAGNNDPPIMLREFVLRRMADLYGPEDSDKCAQGSVTETDWVARLQESRSSSSSSSPNGVL